MDEHEYRAWRGRLRQVTAALAAEAEAAGAQRVAAGVMDALYDPAHPAQGYATLRHGTIWAPESQIRAALDDLRAAGGVPRLRLVDGLYPPQFLDALRPLGLRMVSEHPLLLYPLDMTQAFAGITARPALDPADRRVWLDLAGRPSSAAKGSSDWLIGHSGLAAAARFGAPGGRAARLLIWQTQPGVDPVPLFAAVGSALAIDLLFVETDHPAERAALLELGFRDSGAVITYEEA